MGVKRHGILSVVGAGLSYFYLETAEFTINFINDLDEAITVTKSFLDKDPSGPYSQYYTTKLNDYNRMRAGCDFGLGMNIFLEVILLGFTGYQMAKFVKTAHDAGVFKGIKRKVKRFYSERLSNLPLFNRYNNVERKIEAGMRNLYSI